MNDLYLPGGKLRPGEAKRFENYNTEKGEGGVITVLVVIGRQILAQMRAIMSLNDERPAESRRGRLQ